MHILWRITYVDSRDREFKNRDLVLRTEELDAINRNAVEYALKLRNVGNPRAILRFRHLFREEVLPPENVEQHMAPPTQFHAITIPNYVEDKHGSELSPNQVAATFTGRPNAVLFPSWMHQHDIELALAEKPAIDMRATHLTDAECRVLYLFSRDVRELKDSTFLQSGPGSLKGVSGQNPTLHTVASDEEIRSFVTVFRRLYMKNEEANFSNAVQLFARAHSGHPIAIWAIAACEEFSDDLQKPVRSAPGFSGPVAFPRKRILDVFIYTQYAHQPSEEREAQFRECLNSVGTRAVLTWIFLNEIFKSALQICKCGAFIAEFFDFYRQHHQLTDEVLASLHADSPGIGTMEPESVRRERLFAEAVQQLATELWIKKGRPSGGPLLFEAEARAVLRNALGD